MAFFGFIEKIFGTIIGGVKSVIKDPDAATERAIKLAKIPSDLLAFALPYAKALSSLTPSVADDILVAAAAGMNATVQDILTEPDESVRKGRILTLIGTAVRLKITELLKDAEGQKIKVGKINLRVPEDISQISGDFFDLAAQAAYTLFVKSRDPQRLNEPELQPTL